MNRFPPRKILVPFDCSSRARLAWRHAELLAKRFGAELEAVYVAPYYVGPEVVQLQPLDPAARLRLKNRIAEQVPNAAGVRVAEGDVVLGILNAARRSGADLIVMATQGLSGWRRLERESVTEGVVRGSPIPVLCVRGRPRLPRSVLAPVSLAPHALAGLFFAGEAAAAFGASLVAFHAAAAAGASKVSVEDPAALFRVAEGAAQLGGGLLVSRGRPVPLILAEAPRHGLVVLAVHRRGLLRDALLGTTAEQVLRRCETPVLTVPPQVLSARRSPPRVSRWARGGSRRSDTRLPL